MLGTGVGFQPQYRFSAAKALSLPSWVGWNQIRFPIEVTDTAVVFVFNLMPLDLVDPEIWTGAAIHIDNSAGDDNNSGFAAMDGDFTAAKRTIYRAFIARNATGSKHRVILKAGQYEESAFTRNSKDEPNQPFAILGWGGPIQYRTGSFSVNWLDAGGSYSSPVSAMKSVFRTDVLSPDGYFTEQVAVPDLISCQATLGTWFLDGGMVHVNIGSQPTSGGIALIRSFHGAPLMTHAADIYLEDIHCEGGSTSALHLNRSSTRNIIGVNCSFQYWVPSNPSASIGCGKGSQHEWFSCVF